VRFRRNDSAPLYHNGSLPYSCETEEDYCSPPLAQQRAAVLDTYFDDITVE
jgi:hypothetical protein